VSEADGFDLFKRTTWNGKGTADLKGKGKAVDEEANKPEQRPKVHLSAQLLISAQLPISC
jgi:hypothetical protein